MFLYIALGSAPLDIWVPAIVSLLSLLIAFISILPLILQWIESRDKALFYRIITNAPLTSLEEVRGVQFDAERVKDTRIVILKLWNPGNTAIKPKDYIEPITVLFEKGTIVGSSVRKTQKETPIHLKVTSEDKAVEFPAIQLNPKESITINILVKGPQGEITTQGRIRGVMGIIQEWED